MTDAEKRAMLARLLRDRARGEVESAPQVTADPDHRYEPFPLTDVQQAYWLGRGGAFALGNIACHAYYEVEIAAVDLARFNQAWRRMIERHEMLRAVFLPDGRQQILERVPARDVQVADLRGLPPAEVEAALLAIRDRMSHEVRPADQWPLFEIYIHQLDGRARFHLSFDLLPIDFTSMRVVFNEFFQVYFAPETSLPPLALSFRDCVFALDRQRAAAPYLKARQYWGSRIATLPPAPDLPVRSHRIERPRFVRRSAVLRPDAWQSVKDLAARIGVTGSALLLAAFSEVLAAWSTSPRMCINLTVFNRPPLHPQIQQIVGDFTSLVLVEVDYTAAESFATRARAVQTRLLEDLDHMQYSGVRVMRELAMARGLAAAVMPVVFTSTISRARGAGGHPIAAFPGELVWSVTQTPQVWLDHTVYEQEGALHYNWDALEDQFPDGLVGDLFEAYRQLLIRLADEPELWDTVIRDLVPERQLRVRAEVNATAQATPDAQLHALFDEQARRAPERIAVITPRRMLDYRELRWRARLLARQLRDAGARPNALIAVVMHKGWEQVVAVLAILEAGAAYLPIDPELPPLRIRHLLAHGEVALAVTQPWLSSGSAAAIDWADGVRRFVVDDEPLAGDEPPPLPPVQRPDDLAYVIYTSGSTGQPKGVMIEHRAAVNTVLDINRRFALVPGDRCLGVSALSFDLSVYDIFGVLAAGAALVLPDPALSRDPAHWHELIWTHAVSVWNSAPALLQLVVDHAQAQPVAALPSSLRLVMLSGDWIPVALPDQLRRLAPGAHVVSLGGATEAAIWSICFPIERVDPAWRSIPYGRPLANQRFHVLDREWNPCPAWVPGELYIAGDGLARGYWRDPAQTAAQFVRHPRTAERLYRTGDLGRYLPDGTIEFLGRRDHQVKIAGHRIELGEIEAALATHPEIAECVALAVGDRHDRRLAAAMVTRPGSALAASDVRAFLRERLPDYMVPATVMALDRLPLSVNGKVDRKALVDTVVAARPAAVGPPGDGAPRTAVERGLAALWAETLKLDRVGIHDSFFDLGGDSLLGVQMMLRARAAGLGFGLQHLFTTPTIAELAPWVAAAAEPALADSPLVALQRTGDRPPLFCIHASDGEIDSYLALARCLAGDIPSFGLRQQTLIADLTISQMATGYVEALIRCQPGGPIHLLGWSLGGVIAHEMAQQLRARGRSVALLALVDIAITDLDIEADREDDLVTAYAIHYRPELRAMLAPDGSASDRLDALVRAAAATAGVAVAAIAPFVERIRSNVRALRAYRPAPSAGPALVVRGQRADRTDDALGWRPLFDTVDCVELPASHFDVLRSPAVEQLASIVRAHISKEIG